MPGKSGTVNGVPITEYMKQGCEGGMEGCAEATKTCCKPVRSELSTAVLELVSTGIEYREVAGWRRSAVSKAGMPFYREHINSKRGDGTGARTISRRIRKKSDEISCVQIYYKARKPDSEDYRDLKSGKSFETVARGDSQASRE